MRLNDIFEARRNPDVNTDGRLNDRMSSAFGFLSQFKPIAGDLPTYFVTFTELPKVGINPKSKYQTPIGIYTYPIVPEIVMGHSKKELPFAGEEKYISVVQSAVHGDAILWFDENGTYADYDRDHEKLLTFMQDGYGDDEDVKGFLQTAAEAAYEPLDPQSRIWNESRWVASAEAFMRGSNHVRSLEEVTNWLEAGKNIPGVAINWNYVLRKVLGYSAVVDLNTGTVHQNEPLQAVFLTKEAIQLVDQRRNQNAADRGPKHATMMEFFRLAQGRDVGWEQFYSCMNKVLFPSTPRAFFRVHKVQHYIDRPVGNELDLVLTEIARMHMNRMESAYFKVGLRAMMEKPMFKVAQSTRMRLLEQVIRGIIDYAPIHSQETELHDMAAAIRDVMEKFSFTQQEVRASLEHLELDQIVALL